MKREVQKKFNKDDIKMVTLWITGDAKLTQVSEHFYHQASPTIYITIARALKASFDNGFISIKNK